MPTHVRITGVFALSFFILGTIIAPVRSEETPNCNEIFASAPIADFSEWTKDGTFSQLRTAERDKTPGNALKGASCDVEDIRSFMVTSGWTERRLLSEPGNLRGTVTYSTTISFDLIKTRFILPDTLRGVSNWYLHDGRIVWITTAVAK